MTGQRSNRSLEGATGECLCKTPILVSSSESDIGSSFLAAKLDLMEVAQTQFSRQAIIYEFKNQRL